MGRTKTDGGNSARGSGRLFQHDMGAPAGKAQFGSRSEGRMERPPSVRWKAAFGSSSAGFTRRANCSTYGSCSAGTAGMLTCPPCFAHPLSVGAEGDLILPVASYQKNGFFPASAGEQHRWQGSLCPRSGICQEAAGRLRRGSRFVEMEKPGVLLVCTWKNPATPLPDARSVASGNWG